MGFAAAVPAIVAGISALSSWLGSRKKTTTQESTQDFQGADASSNTTMPVLTSELQQALSVLMPQLQNNLRNSTDLRGYQAEGLRNISNEGLNARAKLAQMIAQRGLGNSPAGAALYARQADDEAGKAISFNNSIPLLARQLQGQDLDRLLKVAAILPTGQTTTGFSTSSRTGTATGSNTDPGNQLAGLFSGLGQGLAATYGYQWALNQRKNAVAGLGGNSGYDQPYAP